MEQLNDYMSLLEKEMSKQPMLVEFEKKTGVKKTHLALGLAATLILFTVLNWAGALIANFVGFIYPTFASFQAIESNTPRDNKLWLTYWVVFAFFSTIEYWSDRLLTWIPFYYFIKSATLLWMYLPATRGATLVYEAAIRPIFVRVDSEAVRLKDEIISNTSSLSGKKEKNIGKVVSQTISELEKAKIALNEDVKKAD